MDPASAAGLYSSLSKTFPKGLLINNRFFLQKQLTDSAQPRCCPQGRLRIFISQFSAGSVQITLFILANSPCKFILATVTGASPISTV
jgi:hypothetical protein